jgi:hypothetical protein
MPIEIRELHIKAIVDAGSDKKGTTAEQSPRKETPEQGEANMESVIDTCVEKILEILKEKMER